MRFIPAPAGNAVELPDRESMMAVHPRACGERKSSAGPCRSAVGSSPRLRGTPETLFRPHACLRFIPAPAGNAWLSHCRSMRAAVHPRACGERHEAGIPPLVITRFIPAPAGNAPAPCRRPASAPVHPRACGERPVDDLRAVRMAGSSPRLRGTLAGQQIGADYRRFIPAPAGNARTMTSS